VTRRRRPGETGVGGVPPEIDTSVPHAARVYDYLLGGMTNFTADREAAEKQAAAFGGLDKARASVRGNRVFLGQVVRYLAGEAGVTQFLDVGTGIPTEPNVHQVAQQVAAKSRVVYVDYDPIVLAHAHQLLNGTEEGATAFVLRDLHDPAGILAQAGGTLDLSSPVAVLLIALLHHVPDEDDPHGIVAELMGMVPPGSYLAISHMANDIEADQMAALARSVPVDATYRFAMRTQTEVTRFFNGLELVDPGVVPIDQWRPNDWPTPPEDRMPAHHWGGVARKP
jgi:hypothetical protein